MVRIITNEFGGANILITADHGFLYTYSPLDEDGKADKTGFVDRIVEYVRRFAIMMKDTEIHEVFRLLLPNQSKITLQIFYRAQYIK